MRIQLYVLRQLLLSIAFSMAGLGVIVLPTVAIQAVNKLGAPTAATIFHYLPLVVAELVPYLLPLAFLLGVVGTYGRLAAERELIAIEMAGIHPGTLAIPGLCIALPLVVLTDRLLAEVSPDLKFLERNQLGEADLKKFMNASRWGNVLAFKDNLLIGENRGGVWHDATLKLGDQKIHVAEVWLEFHDQDFVIHMRQAKVDGANGSFQDDSPTRIFSIAEVFPPQSKSKSKVTWVTSSELQESIEARSLAPDAELEARYEIQRRHALSATYLVFLLLGIPTGVVLRSNTQLAAFTGAIGYAFLYYVLAMRLGKVLSATGVISPFLAAWATNGLFLALGLVFFVRAVWR